MIAAALRAELGDSHRATKTVMRWTGATERMVKHWFTARHGPSGKYLLVLIRECDAVFDAVLSNAGRHDTVVAARLWAARGALIEVMELAERGGLGPPAVRSTGADLHVGPAKRALNDRDSDRIIDPTDDLVRKSAGPSRRREINLRQRWCLDALAAGRDLRADDLCRRWSVSEKTARRDVAALKQRGMIEFVGSRRSGRYQLRR
jgi:hypothetical protein